jgi:uncharacterized RDD family membrane protein YckC
METLPESTIKRVSFFTRVIAIFFDAIGISLLSIGLSYIIMQWTASNVADGFDAYSMFSGGLGLVFVPIILSILLIFMEGYYGTDIGKMYMGLRIANQDGTRASTQTLMTRAFLKHAGSITYYALVPILGVVSETDTIATLLYKASMGYSCLVFVGCFAALGAGRQALHDVVCHTAVFYTEDIVE